VNAEHTLTDKDLYVLHKEEILADDFEIEYCLNTQYEPLIVYVPQDIDYAEFKLQAKYCCDRIADLRKLSRDLVETKKCCVLEL